MIVRNSRELLLLSCSWRVSYVLLKFYSHKVYSLENFRYNISFEGALMLIYSYLAKIIFETHPELLPFLLLSSVPQVPTLVSILFNNFVSYWFLFSIYNLPNLQVIRNKKSHKVFQNWFKLFADPNQNIVEDKYS